MNQPTFIVIGAHKAATTSLHHYLQQHRQIYLVPNKGSDLLTRRNIQSLEEAEEYLTQFGGVKDETALGEVSSVYLHAEGVAQRMSNLFPQVKIIAILRNPVERAYSHAFYENTYTKKEIENIQSIVLQSDKFLQPGYYYHHLKNYFELFDREQIKLMLYDDLINDSQSFLKEIFTFIDVDNTFQPSMEERLHKGKIKVNSITRNSWESIRSNQEIKTLIKLVFKPILPKIQKIVVDRTEISIPPLSEQFRKKLIEVYTEDIVELQKLTGLDCSQWLYHNGSDKIQSATKE